MFATFFALIRLYRRIKILGIMKNTTNTTRITFSLLLFSILTVSTVFASPVNNDTILEITDRNNQITLEISDEYVTVTVTEELRELYNNEIRVFERKEWHTFTDSGGNYIPSSHSYLDSDVIEIPLSEIQNISIIDGSLDFKFVDYTSTSFKSVLSDLGSDFFKSFSHEDLESFHQAYLSTH